ncbi:MAG: glutamyl-tRNA reductase [Pseudomonadota bacterium]
MTLLAVGLNYQTAPIKIRERVSFNLSHLESALIQLKNNNIASEALILSTCNRTELYCDSESMIKPGDWLAHYHGIEPDDLTPYLYFHPDENAIKHAFRVACGLNSMVLGEPQILGQFRHAIQVAREAGSLGINLHRLFQSTLSVAKQVRTTTDIGSASISMASAVVKLAERLFPKVSDQRVLLIGAGEMMDLVATHLAAENPQTIVVANRTLDRANTLAKKFNGLAITLEDIPLHLPTSDIIVSCTASPLPIIGKGAVERALLQRKHYPMFMVDLAVPRDIEPEVGTLEDIFLYTVDDLAGVIQQGLNIRQSAITDAEQIIEAEVNRFINWQQQRSIVPLIQSLQQQAEGWRQHAVKRAQKLLARGESPEMALEELSRILTQKWIHPPLSCLNSSEPSQWAQKISQLYNLDTFDSPLSDTDCSEP